MTIQLPNATVVIIVGLGVMSFVLLFIFAKRQIMRFALRSRRGPHAPIGHGAKKALRKEIERRIAAIPRILHEPRLLMDDDRYIMEPGEKPSYYYRFKAVDDIKILELEIARQDAGLKRHPSESVRSFLLSSLASALDVGGQKLVHQFCDMYEQARHDPADFLEEDYQNYRRLFLKLLDAARLLKTTSSNKSSPNRTPVKKPMTGRNLLDPTRLRAPSSLAVSNKLGVAALHNHYTTLQNASEETSLPCSLQMPVLKVDSETTV